MRGTEGGEGAGEEEGDEVYEGEKERARKGRDEVYMEKEEERIGEGEGDEVYGERGGRRGRR